MLIFPSKLERSLIFWMLGPMALVQAGMFFADFARFNDFKTIDLADALVNICDASLALLYTSGLLIWGGFVNWRRAWRTDGSTAAFGISVLVVAVCKTVVSFVHIAYDRAYWIRLLSATFTNWQCWLGFWWWVSAGMGSMRTVCVRGGRNTLFQPKSPVRRNDALCLIRRRQDSLLIRPCGIPVRSGRVRSRLVRPRCRTSHRPCQTRTRPHLPFAFYETCYRVRHSRSDDAMNIFATRTIELFATQHCHRRPCMRESCSQQM